MEGPMISRICNHCVNHVTEASAAVSKRMGVISKSTTQRVHSILKVKKLLNQILHKHMHLLSLCILKRLKVKPCILLTSTSAERIFYITQTMTIVCLLCLTSLKSLKVLVLYLVYIMLRLIIIFLLGAMAGIITT